jgi:dUTP pyrophosphatase
MPELQVTVKVLRFRLNAKFPEYAKPSDSCFDIFAADFCELKPGDVATIPTGIGLQAPKGWGFQILDRSGLASKGITRRGGVIDNGYTGEIKVVLVNESQQPFLVELGDKIAQVKLERIYHADFVQVNAFDATDRGNAGFGSTGYKGSVQ